jgi:hypothetical protein
MPTQEAQSVINAAIPLAVRYALLKKHGKESKPTFTIDSTGYIELHGVEGADATQELDNLLEAVTYFIESIPK